MCGSGRGIKEMLFVKKRIGDVMGRSKYEILLAVLSDQWRCDWAT
jgi:hypothetical protein